MREVFKTAPFSRDFKKAKHSGRYDIQEILASIELLRNDLPLPARFRDHALSGNFRKYRDCHITSNLVLIYAKPENQLVLMRLDTHAKVFQKRPIPQPPKTHTPD
jgi:mRNA interferase YafQ